MIIKSTTYEHVGFGLMVKYKLYQYNKEVIIEHILKGLWNEKLKEIFSKGALFLLIICRIPYCKKVMY